MIRGRCRSNPGYLNAPVRLKDMEKLVSILLVSCNAEKFISKTILSCLRQTYGNIELLILDIDSKDATADIIKSFSDRRIRFYRGERNLGPYEGLNYLMERAGGDFIAIQDHDDIWLRQKVERQIGFLNDNPDFAACGTNTFFFYEKKDVLILIESPFITDIVNHTSLVFRRTDLRYDTGYLLADEHFMKKVIGRSGKIACIQEPLCIHRIRADARNLSLRRFSPRPDHIKDFFAVNGLSSKSLHYFLYLSTCNILPESMIWYIRKHFTLKNREWISRGSFELRHPDILL